MSDESPTIKKLKAILAELNLSHTYHASKLDTQGEKAIATLINSPFIGRIKALITTGQMPPEILWHKLYVGEREYMAEFHTHTKAFEGLLGVVETNRLLVTETGKLSSDVLWSGTCEGVRDAVVSFAKHEKAFDAALKLVKAGTSDKILYSSLPEWTAARARIIQFSAAEKAFDAAVKLFESGKVKAEFFYHMDYMPARGCMINFSKSEKAFDAAVRLSETGGLYHGILVSSDRVNDQLRMIEFSKEEKAFDVAVRLAEATKDPSMLYIVDRDWARTRLIEFSKVPGFDAVANPLDVEMMKNQIFNNNDSQRNRENLANFAQHEKAFAAAAILVAEGRMNSKVLWHIDYADDRQLMIDRCIEGTAYEAAIRLSSKQLTGLIWNNGWHDCLESDLARCRSAFPGAEEELKKINDTGKIIQTISWLGNYPEEIKTAGLTAQQLAQMDKQTFSAKMAEVIRGDVASTREAFTGSLDRVLVQT